MKAGDLVKHNTKGNARLGLKKIFEDWGWMPDFFVGVVTDVKEQKDGKSFASVYYVDINLKEHTPTVGWYPTTELRLL